MNPTWVQKNDWSRQETETALSLYINICINWVHLIKVGTYNKGKTLPFDDQTNIMPNDALRNDPYLELSRAIDCFS